MSPLEYAAMLKQVSLLLTCVSGHIGILILISKRFLFRQQKENQPSPHVTSRVCRHAQTGQSSAHLCVGACPDLDSHFKEVSVPSTDREPTFTSCHPSVCRHAQTGQSSAHLCFGAYPDLDSHFKEVSVPAIEREKSLYFYYFLRNHRFSPGIRLKKVPILK
jgi:hypothetical protein